MTKFCLLPVLVFTATLQAGGAKPQESWDGYQEHVVVGTIVAMKPDIGQITIRECDFLGHLRMRFKSYRVKQAFLLNDLHTGEKITGVFSTKDRLLHRLRQVETYRAFAQEHSR